MTKTSGLADAKQGWPNTPVGSVRSCNVCLRRNSAPYQREGSLASGHGGYTLREGWQVGTAREKLF
jgi:hypothetical protein